MLWLGGGAAQIDTFDPKRRGDGKKKAGSYYDAIPTAIPGTQVCEHLGRTARRLDRCVLVRTLHHDVIDEHAAATNIVHTGRPVSGTVIYPSLGSIVAHERGAAGDGVPAYVVMGYPNVTRGPGFLGAKYGYVYLIDTESGPTGLTPPADVAPPRRVRREALLESLRADYQAENPGEAAIADYVAASREAARLAGPALARTFQLDSEPAVAPRGLRRRVRPALPAGAPPGRGGRPVRRGRAQPQLPQRHRLGHPQPGSAQAARADRRARPGAVGLARRPRARRPARLDAGRRRHRVRPSRRLRRRRRPRPPVLGLQRPAGRRRPAHRSGHRHHRRPGQDDRRSTRLDPRLPRHDLCRPWGSTRPRSSTPPAARSRSPTTATRSPSCSAERVPGLARCAAGRRFPASVRPSCSPAPQADQSIGIPSMSPPKNEERTT